MHSVEKKFRRTMDQVISIGDRILVAVSGGPDSVVMLHLLNKLQSGALDFTIAIAHLNHLVRGEDSRKDADFVTLLGEQLGLETFIEEVDVGALCRNGDSSFQETARIARLDFLNRTLKKWRGNIIALGHNADDQAETLLINMLRGSGLLGLTGIPARRDYLIRPLHDCHRDEIENYIEIHDLKFRFDKTNHEKKYLRNRIRLELLPLLEEYNPQIRSSFNETCRLLRDDEDYLERQVDKIFEQARVDMSELEHSALKVDFMRVQHPAVQKRLIRRAILEVKGDLRSISARHVSDILHLLSNFRGGKEIHLPGDLKAEYAGNILSFYKNPLTKNAIPTSERGGIYSATVNVPGWTDIGTVGLRLNTRLIHREMVSSFSYRPNRAYLDYDKTGAQIKVRFFRPGDRFIPLGMKGTKKLKSFFIDEKVPQNERRSVPILTSQDDDIIWVYEKRIGENYRVTDKTRRVLFVEGVTDL